MFIDDSAIEQVEKLSKKYKETWGKEIDYTVMPKGMTQKRLVKCIELMIESNISLLVAYHKLY